MEPAACDSHGSRLPTVNALQGDAVTSRLKRVTDDMKTKNRADRSGVVPVSASPAKGAATAGVSRAAAAPRGPPRFELEAGRKWVVENQIGNRGIVIEDTDPKQTVYIYGCTDSTIQVTPRSTAVLEADTQPYGCLSPHLIVLHMLARHLMHQGIAASNYRQRLKHQRDTKHDASRWCCEYCSTEPRR